MTPPVAGRLATPEFGRRLLDGVVEYFTLNGGNPPDRRYLCAGEPAWDGCEQLTVALLGIQPGASPGTGDEPHRTGRPLVTAGIRHYRWNVSIVRCVTTFSSADDLPDPSDLDADGVIHMRDAGLLSQALVYLLSDEDPAGLLYGITVTAPAVEPVGPQGGLCSVEGSFTAEAARYVT